MFVKYEGAIFKAGWSSSIERHLIKQAIKKKIGRWIGKPYQSDLYLEWSKKFLLKKQPSVVVDIGANIGTTVLPLAVKFPTTAFYAVEPHPLPAANLIKNCENNNVRNVTLVSSAVGTETMAQIYTCPTNSGGHRLTGFTERKESKKCPPFGPIFVPMQPLSHLFDQFKITHCNLLKVDTEGYEFYVLESLGDKVRPDCIVAEYGAEGFRQAGKSGWDLIDLMLEKGYQCTLLGSDKKLKCAEDLPDVPDFSVIDLLFSLT